MKRYVETGLMLTLAASCTFAQSPTFNATHNLLPDPYRVDSRVTIAAVHPHTPVKHYVWMASLGFMATAQVLDIVSSVGKNEANPTIGNHGGQFNTGRAVMLKSAIFGGMGMVEIMAHHFSHSHETDAMFAAGNIAVGGLETAVAVHNFGVEKVK